MEKMETCSIGALAISLDVFGLSITDCKDHPRSKDVRNYDGAVVAVLTLDPQGRVNGVSGVNWIEDLVIRVMFRESGTELVQTNLGQRIATPGEATEIKRKRQEMYDNIRAHVAK